MSEQKGPYRVVHEHEGYIGGGYHFYVLHPSGKKTHFSKRRMGPTQTCELLNAAYHEGQRGDAEREQMQRLLLRLATAAIASDDKQGMWTAVDRETGNLVYAITPELARELLEWKKRQILKKIQHPNTTTP